MVYIAMYSIVIPVGAGIYFFNTLSKNLKILLASLCIVLFFDVLLRLFDSRTANIFLYLFTLFDALMMSWVFYLSVPNKTAGRVILITGYLFIPLIVVDAFFIAGLQNYGYSNIIEKVYVLAITIYFLSQLFQEKTESNLLKLPMFWVSAAVIVNNLIASFDVFRGPVMNYSQNLYLQYYMFWCVITVFMYLAFAYAFRLSRLNTG